MMIDTFFLYPARFTPAEEGGYLVDFFDFDSECFTEGDTLDEAYRMAMDVLEGTVLGYIKENQQLPKRSGPTKCLGDGFISYVGIELDTLEKRKQNKH